MHLILVLLFTRKKEILNRGTLFLLVAFVISFSGFAQTTVTIKPGANIDSAVRRYPQGGTTFIIKAGEHRMQKITPNNNDKFIGEPGAILTGAMVLSKKNELGKWIKQGNYWVYSGVTVGPGQLWNAGVKKGYKGWAYPEDLYKDDNFVVEDSTLAATGLNEWYFDYANDKIYLYDDPSSNADDPVNYRMELSVTRSAFTGPNKKVTIRGLIIEKYAIPGHFAAVGDNNVGPDWIIENNVVRLNHGQGIGFTGRAIIRGNKIYKNGQMGLGGTRSIGALVENNEMYGNTINGLGFDWMHEGGATKFSRTDSLVIRNNLVYDNNGPGLWTDIRNIHTVYEGNICRGDKGPEIFHELGYAAIIRCNTVDKNRDVNQPAILLASSENVEVYNNKVIVDNLSGHAIHIWQRFRYSKVDGDSVVHYSRNNYIHHNDITYVHDTRTTGATEVTYDAANFWAKGNNRFNYNRYHVPTTTDVSQQRRWVWAGAARNWAEFKSYGHEANGTVDNNASASTLPVVNAGLDKTVTLPAGITLTGSVSAPFTIRSYNWTKQSGPGATMSGATTSTLTLSNLAAGTYVFRLTVTDQCGNAAFDDVSVVVQNALETAAFYRAINFFGPALTIEGQNWSPAILEQTLLTPGGPSKIKECRSFLLPLIQISPL